MDPSGVGTRGDLYKRQTQLTRWLPFLAFPTPEKTPKTVTYLGKVLPACMWGLLIVYCFRTGDPFSCLLYTSRCV